MASQSYTRTRRTNPSWSDYYASQQGVAVYGWTPIKPITGKDVVLANQRQKQQQADAYAATQAQLQADNRSRTLLYVGLAVAGYFLYESM